MRVQAAKSYQGIWYGTIPNDGKGSVDSSSDAAIISFNKIMNMQTVALPDNILVSVQRNDMTRGEIHGTRLERVDIPSANRRDAKPSNSSSAAPGGNRSHDLQNHQDTAKLSLLQIIRIVIYCYLFVIVFILPFSILAFQEFLLAHWLAASLCAAGFRSCWIGQFLDRLKRLDAPTRHKAIQAKMKVAISKTSRTPRAWALHSFLRISPGSFHLVWGYSLRLLYCTK